jgi:thiamine biosynthesis lipoprotein
VRLVLFAGDSTLARSAAAAAFDRIRTLEDTMSDYRDESEVRRLSRHPGEWVTVSPALFEVLSEALILAKQSDGGFDPTMGPVTRLWRRARRDQRYPPPDSLASAMQLVGYRLVELAPARRAIRLTRPGMLLDLGGIAKGFILDRALQSARMLGVDRLLIQAGGDVVAGDPPPGLPGWRIEVEGAGTALTTRAASLANAALATSGDSEQFVLIEGVRYSHVVDPRTGRPLTDGRRAYVIARSGSIADGLATALTVVSDTQATRLVQYYPDVMVEVISPRWDGGR